MERRNIIILGAAVLFALLAVYLANAWFSGVEKRQEVVAEQRKLTRIAVAARAMDFGAPLTADNIRMVSWPADSVPQGAYRDGEGQKLLTSGEVAIRPIAQGEPILVSRISSRAVLSANIPGDMRAVTVPVDAVSGVAGFVTPGDVVDVMLTRQIPGDGATGDDKMTHVIMENVQVLAMDLRAGEQNTDPTQSRTATLQVDPQGAQKLALATQIGRLSLALRNVENQIVGPRRAVTTRDLGGGYYIPARNRGGASAVPVPAVATRIPVIPAAGGAIQPRPTGGPQMTVVRGTAASVQEVQRYGF
ncbi:Flp pilus assembly protein [Caenibius tardaugens NBRC 16725]|uniref:Flp pilus assembly protein n=1 Tax=Caenibius tardaugens NBRC 16725 TaxID=1219035 RepID=U2YNP9_9SPHN|nr:Flp pilus assembly protein CpaB [Caenibius tardaugens]GAD50480.1 Flp pilus assembly protein [Caenibius tardaugens NBRC 16725]